MRRVGLLLAALMAVSGCSAAGGDQARAAAERFYKSLERADVESACALLAPETRENLEESADEPCEGALAQEGLAAHLVRNVEIYGESAFIELDGDTAFLGRFDDGWRVSAAGCEERQGRPYNCSVEAG